MNAAAFPDEAARRLLLRQLTPLEREQGAAYLYVTLLRSTDRLSFPHLVIEVPWDQAVLAFIDRQPEANWSHAARYVLADLISGASRSYDASLPAFQPAQSGAWRLLYRAPAVPETVLLIKGT